MFDIVTGLINLAFIIQSQTGATGVKGGAPGTTQIVISHVSS